MNKFSAQKGFAPLFVIITLLLGLAAGVYLVQKQTQLKPKASGENVIFVKDMGNGKYEPITSSTTNTVLIKLTSPAWPYTTNIQANKPNKEVSNTTQPGLGVGKLKDTDKDGFTDSEEGKIGTNHKTICPRLEKKGKTDGWPPDVNNDGVVNDKDASFLIPFMDQKRKQSKKKYDKRYDLNTDKKIDEKDLDVIKKYFLRSCNKPLQPTPTSTPYAIPTNTPTPIITPIPVPIPTDAPRPTDIPTPTYIPSPITSPNPTEAPITTVSITISEDPNFTNKEVLPYKDEPFSYTFKNTTSGQGYLYVMFNSSKGGSQKAYPFPATIKFTCGVSCPVRPSSSPYQTSLPTPRPTIAGFSNIKANMTGFKSDITFDYSGPPTPYFRVDAIAIIVNPSYGKDTLEDFMTGKSSPLSKDKIYFNWKGYRCGNWIYYKIYNADKTYVSPEQSAIISCDKPIVNISNIYGDNSRLPQSLTVNIKRGTTEKVFDLVNTYVTTGFYIDHPTPGYFGLKWDDNSSSGTITGGNIMPISIHADQYDLPTFVAGKIIITNSTDNSKLTFPIIFNITN